MNEKELDSLEKDAMALRDAKVREEALKGIAELRSLRAHLDQEVELATRKASQGPAREPTGLLKSLHLYSRLKSPDVGIKKHAMDEIRFRREKEEQLIKQIGEKLKNPVYREQVKTRFRSRKWQFRFTTLLLVAIMILVIVNAPSWGWTRDGTMVAVVLGFALAYWYAGERLWRCPACNFKLPLNPRHGRSTAKLCPRCSASFS